MIQPYPGLGFLPCRLKRTREKAGDFISGTNALNSLQRYRYSSPKASEISPTLCTYVIRLLCVRFPSNSSIFRHGTSFTLEIRRENGARSRNCNAFPWLFPAFLIFVLFYSNDFDSLNQSQKITYMWSLHVCLHWYLNSVFFVEKFT